MDTFHSVVGDLDEILTEMAEELEAEECECEEFDECEWEEFDDYSLEDGFDPYEGGYTYDC